MRDGADGGRGDGRQPAKKKQCFVVGPIGDDDSDDRIHADWLLEAIIVPVMVVFPDFEVVRSDQIATPGLIDKQVFKALLEADLVIADLTTLNPNAFYEIGIRHMGQKPIIHMHLAGQKIPFDVSLFRSIKFDWVRPRDIETAKSNLRKAVEAVTAEGYEVDNPLTRAMGSLELVKHATPAERVVLDQLEEMNRRIANVEATARKDPLGTARPSYSFVREEGELSAFGGRIRVESVGGPLEGRKTIRRFLLNRLGSLNAPTELGDSWIEVQVPATFSDSDIRRLADVVAAEFSGVIVSLRP